MPDWLTYAQAGVRFGLSPDAVRMRAARLGWRTQPGNDGRTLVQIPDDAVIEPRARSLARSDEHSDAHAPEQNANIGRLTALLSAADVRIEKAEQRAERAEARADRAEKRADLADSDRRAAEVKAEQAESRADAERARAATLRDEAVELQARVAEIEAEGHTLTVEAAELSAQVRAAQIAQAEAEADAAELRQTDAVRRGRGRLARAWAAWQGR
jgi:hypothetical protein